MKLYFLLFSFIFLSGCFHETSLINNYGQRIVKIPNQTESIDDVITGKNINKANVSSSNKDINILIKLKILIFLLVNF